MDEAVMVRALLIAIALRECGHTYRYFVSARRKQVRLPRRKQIGYLSAILFAIGAILVALGYVRPYAEQAGWGLCGISLFITTATPCSYAWVNSHGAVFVIRNIFFALQGSICIWYALTGFGRPW